MGQSQQSKPREANQVVPSIRYEVDLHLIEQESIVPSTFSYEIQKLIAQIQALTSQIEEHPIERYLIHTLDHRFSRVTVADEDAFHLGKDFKRVSKERLEWSELRSKEQFLRLIRRLQKSYHIQVRIKQEYEKQIESLDKKVVINSQTSFQSFRKNSMSNIPIEENMDMGLIMRLILFYYLKMFKINANSNKIVLKFHQQTGRMLCLLIFYQYLALEQLFQIFYELICVDKCGEGVLSAKLNDFHRKYNGICLKHSYSINLKKRRLETLQTAARIYLDQLYLKSLEEAEDPEIKNTDDTLLPIKMFPISRVKDKQRI